MGQAVSVAFRDPQSVLYDVHAALEAYGANPKQCVRDSFTSRCPAHDDRDPSLSVSTGDKGIVLHCFAGCHTEDILNAIGFDYSDIFYEQRAPDTTTPPAFKIATVTPIRQQSLDAELKQRLEDNPDIIALIEHERRISGPTLKRVGCGLTHDKRLVIPTYARDGDLAPREWLALADQRIPGQAKIKGPRGAKPDLWPRPESPLYADNTSILIVEGEPDALVAIDQHLQVCGLPGVNTWQTDDAKRFTRFNTVTVLLDDDDTGREASRIITRDLRRAGINVIERHHTPGNPTRRDLTDLARETTNLAHAIEQLPIIQPDTLYNKLNQIDINKMLDTEPEPRIWIWDDYFTRGTLNMLHGAAGLGKSMIGLAIAAACTQHAPDTILGHIINPSRVTIIDAENSEDEIHRRLRTAGIQNRDKLRYYRADITILGQTETRDLFTEIAKHSDIVILDSMRGLWDGDEKEQAEAGRMLRDLARIAEATNLCIIIIHHDTKAGQYSGSSDIDAAISGSRLHIQRAGDPKKKPTDDDDEWLERILTHAKCRIGAEQRPIRFKLSIDERIYLHPSTGPTSDLDATCLELYEWAQKHPAWPNVPIEDVKARAGIDERNDWRKIGAQIRNGKWAKPYNGKNSRVIEFIIDVELEAA